MNGGLHRIGGTNRRESEELRNNSPVKLATFPSFYPRSFSSSSFFHLPLPPPLCSLLFSQTCTISVPPFFSFNFAPPFSLFARPLPPGFVTPPLACRFDEARSKLLVDALFSLRTQAPERAQAREFAYSAGRRSFRNAPTGNVDTLSSTEIHRVPPPLIFRKSPVCRDNFATISTRKRDGNSEDSNITAKLNV